MGADFNMTPCVQNVDRSAAHMAPTQNTSDAGSGSKDKQQPAPATPTRKLVSAGVACIKIWEEEQSTIEAHIKRINADTKGPSDSFNFDSDISSALQKCMDYGVTLRTAEAAMRKAYSNYYPDPLLCRIHRMAAEHENRISNAIVSNPKCEADKPVPAKSNTSATPPLPLRKQLRLL
jgi:hypothetical protein